MSEQQERAISVAGQLSAALDAVGAEIASLRADMDADRAASEERDALQARYSRLTRILLLIAGVCLVVDISGTSVAVIALVRSTHNSATIADIRQSNLQGCETFNVRLAKQEASIDGILQPAANATAAERAAAEKYLAAARAKIAVGWAPKDCRRAYKLP